MRRSTILLARFAAGVIVGTALGCSAKWLGRELAQGPRTTVVARPFAEPWVLETYDYEAWLRIKQECADRAAAEDAR